MMNGRERVLKILKGEKVDRLPFSLLLSLYGAKLTNQSLYEYYKSPQSYLQAQSIISKNLNPDILIAPFITVLEAESFGSKVKYFSDQPPNLLLPVASNKEEIANLSPPDIKKSPRLSYYMETLKLMVENFKEFHLIGAPILSPLDLPLLLLGIDLWMQIFLFEDDYFKKMLNITTPHFIKWGNSLLKEGADFLILPIPFLNKTLLTKQMVETKCIPFLIDVFSKIEGPIFLHHTGAPFIDFLDLFPALPNVAGFVIDECDNFKDARKKTGDAHVLLTGIDGKKIACLKQHEIEEAVNNIRQSAIGDKKFIFSSTGPDIPIETPFENLLILSKVLGGIK